jgi:hypothetical protein
MTEFVVDCDAGVDDRVDVAASLLCSKRESTDALRRCDVDGRAGSIKL